MRCFFGCDAVATYWTKVVVTAVLVGWWLWGPLVGYSPAGGTSGHAGMLEHLLWPLGHVNFWHLAANVFCLWCMKGRLRVAVCYAVAVVCSFLPVWGLWEIGATAGFSGVLFALCGERWGAWCRGCKDIAAYGTFARRVLPFVFVGALVPGVNWCIHGYCLMGGFAYGYFRAGSGK